jgi:thiamine biosynthesis lipoprotein
VRHGFSVRDTHLPVTVAASTCVDAGLLATLAMLLGLNAERFLSAQGVRHWSLR